MTGSEDTLLRIAAAVIASGVIGGGLLAGWRVARAVFRIESAIPELIELGRVLAVQRARGTPVDLQELLDESPVAHAAAFDAQKRVTAVEGTMIDIKGSVHRIDKRLDLLVDRYDAEHQRLRRALEAALADERDDG